jgi:hypothetical protein
MTCANYGQLKKAHVILRERSVIELPEEVTEGSAPWIVQRN